MPWQAVVGFAVAGWVLLIQWVWHATSRPPRPPPKPETPPPLPPPITPSDRGWKEERYAPPEPQPPDKTTVYFQALLRQPVIPAASGVGYETWLLARFTGAGWQLHKTPLTGDYGADLIGTDPHGARWVIQAKAWRAPVGVHAVQEVLAAKVYYEATRAAVIATQTFTPNARLLAQKARVQLITLIP